MGARLRVPTDCQALAQLTVREGEHATITVVASDDGWVQFLAPVPRPFYQDLLGGCVQHHGFQVAGDILSLSAYYQASTRLFAVMRALRAAPAKGSS